MTQKILLCVDGSPWACSAADVAFDLHAGEGESELTVLHVVNVVPPSGNLIKDLPGRLGFEPAIVTEEQVEQQDDYGRNLLGTLKVQAQQRGLEVTTVLEHGAVVERIAHWAERCDLLVLGMWGETEVRYPGTGGSCIQGVIARTARATLLVPASPRRPLRALALGYDGSEAAHNSVAVASTIVEALRLPVHAIYISADGGGSEILDEVDPALPAGTEVHRHLVRSDDVHESLASTAESCGASILAVGFRGRSPLKDFVFGTAAEYIVGNTRLLVLVTH